MSTGIAIVVILLGALAWVGQLLSAVVPAAAARLGLIEQPEEVDPTFYADARGEAIWDTFMLWTLPVAGVLLLVDHDGWRSLGLAGGAIYVYFAGRGIVTRRVLRKRGVSIGSPSTVVMYNVTLALWGMSGAAMIAWSLNAYL